MPVPVTCSCGKTYTFKDEFAGRRAKCPACGAVLTVPGEPQHATVAVEAGGRRFSKVEIAAFIVAGVAVLAVAIILPAMFLGGGSKRDKAPAATKEPLAAKTSLASKTPVAPKTPPGPPEPVVPPETPPGPPEPAVTPETPPGPPEPAVPPEAAVPPETPPGPSEPAVPPETPPAPSTPPAVPPPPGRQEGPFDLATLKAGRYANQQVRWQGKVLAITSRRPGIVSVLLYEQDPVRIDASLHLRGNLPGGVDPDVTVTFDGTVAVEGAGPGDQPTRTLTIKGGLIDLGAIPAPPASPPAAPAPAAPTPPATPAPGNAT